MSTMEQVAIVQHEFTIHDVPPSMNTNAERNRHGSRASKKNWQEMFVVALDELDLPRPIPAVGPLFVDMQFTFPNPGKQESENRRPKGSKSAGDAFTGKHGSTPGMGRGRSVADKLDRAFWTGSGARIRCGWLLDDSDKDWRLMTTINPVKGRLSTRVRLAWFDRTPPSEEAGWMRLALLRGEADNNETREFLAL